jgi:hypothetical protein
MGSGYLRLGKIRGLNLMLAYLLFLVKSTAGLLHQEREEGQDLVDFLSLPP